MPALEFAIRYADRALHTIPIGARGKRPIFDDWTNRGSVNHVQLATWFGTTDRNIGIVCGPSDIAVIDIDPRNGGDATFEKLIDELGPLPLTWTNESGGGGVHLVFRRPAGDLISKLGLGVDLLRDGRQFLVEPSVHPSGGLYRWRAGSAPWDRVLADLPDAWRNRIVAPTPVRYVVDMPVVTDDTKRKRASAYVAKMPGAIAKQGGHDQLWQVTLTLVRGFDLDVSSARAILVNEYNPRCDPPWSPREIEHKLVDAYERSNAEHGYLLKSDSPRSGVPRSEQPRASARAPRGTTPPSDELAQRRSRAATPPAQPLLTNSAGYGPGGSYRLTDVGNARRFADTHAGQLRYVHAWGEWLRWDGKRWKRDDAGTETQAAKSVLSAMYLEAASRVHTAAAAINAGDSSGPTGADTLIKHTQATAKSARIDAMIRLARSEPELATQRELFDRDPMLLNVANGTIDLNDGEIRKHRQNDMLTMLAPYEYDPTAECHAWLKFLERVIPDTDTRDWIQRYLGYALTGNVREQCLAFFVGGGANGKSVLLDVVMDLMGDYAWRAPAELVLSRFGESHPTEVAALESRRLVACSEIDQGRMWHEARIKQLTGDGKISARKMRQDFYEFEQTAKFIIAANTRPSVKGTDNGIWRRMRYVPWTVRIPEAEQDRDLPRRLLADEAPGILAWLVRGCLSWQRMGLGSASAIDSGTAAYRAEQDVLGQWVRDCCVLDGWESIASLYESWVTWSKAEGLDRPWAKKVWKARLEEQWGITEGRFDHGRVRALTGIRQKPIHETCK